MDEDIPADLHDFENINEEAQEGVTIVEVLNEMKKVWEFERVSPLLLPHRLELVDVLVNELDKLEKGMAEAKKAGVAGKNEIVGARKYEVARVRYIINSYLRCRLQKIERNPADVMARHLEANEKGHADLLDAHEVTFTENIVRSNCNYFNQSFLGLLPPGLDKPVVSKDRSELKRCFVKVHKHVNVNIFKMDDPNSDNASISMMIR
ncbi:unnamed protein product [Bursaphelenchus xylophilus]|uniref:(pine wood nematode) hypothetical protein n=1 Tax=Bursaphelenchus xylophilus TaxID=6326 RepID=A0A7I8X6M6_BURXY|nr:unnamed protein product [Bursaphelenchus xylophilus]CAG9123514.1 unnamed protein product [Bursaphelenchus xylophilus]